jgi:hypothetical protein
VHEAGGRDGIAAVASKRGPELAIVRSRMTNGPGAETFHPTSRPGPSVARRPSRIMVGKFWGKNLSETARTQANQVARQHGRSEPSRTPNLFVLISRNEGVPGSSPGVGLGKPQP